ncbi:MAG: hypothetical protein V4667_10440 [Bacteroidota bacterium]
MRQRLILLFLTLLFGCVNSDDSPPKKVFPIDPKELSFKRGDYFSFPLDADNYGIAIICDYDKDEAGLWYAVLYTNYHSDTVTHNPLLTDVQVFGRKVTSTLNEKGYELLLDGEFISDSLIKVEKYFKHVGHIALDEKTAKLRAYGATTEFQVFLSGFRSAIEERSPDKKEDKLIKLLLPKNSEGYYPLTDFTK